MITASNKAAFEKCWALETPTKAEFEAITNAPVDDRLYEWWCCFIHYARDYKARHPTLSNIQCFIDTWNSLTSAYPDFHVSMPAQ